MTRASLPSRIARPDALGAVLEHKVRAGNVLFNVGGDLRERLFAGVLLGDEDEVAVLPAQLAEVFSALERVGAGAAEDGDHLAAGVFDLGRAVERVKAPCGCARSRR